MASQPINEGGQSPGAPKVQGAPSATCKNLCYEIITDTLLTSDTLIISGECYDPDLAFKTQVFLPVIDTALFQLQSRFEGLHLVSGSFSFLCPKSLLQLSDADLNSAAQKFQETYSADIDSDFVAELRSFTFAICHRTFVCLSSVCNVHAPYLGD